MQIFCNLPFPFKNMKRRSFHKYAFFNRCFSLQCTMKPVACPRLAAFLAPGWLQVVNDSTFLLLGSWAFRGPASGPLLIFLCGGPKGSGFSHIFPCLRGLYRSRLCCVWRRLPANVSVWLRERLRGLLYLKAVAFNTLE